MKINFACSFDFLVWLLENLKSCMWLASYFYWTALV